MLLLLVLTGSTSASGVFNVTSVADFPTAVSAAVAAGGGTIQLPATPLVMFVDLSNVSVPLTIQGTLNGQSGFQQPANTLCPGANVSGSSTAGGTANDSYLTNAIFKGGSNCTLKNLTINGVYSNQIAPVQGSGASSTFSGGLVFANKSNITLTDVEVRNTGYAGMTFFQCNNVTLTRPYVHDLSAEIIGPNWYYSHALGIFSFCISPQSDGLTIVDPVIDNCGLDGIQTWGKNVTVRGTVLGAGYIRNAGTPIAAGRCTAASMYIAATSTNVLVDKIIAINATESGIAVAGAISAGGANGVTIQNCVSYNNPSAAYSLFGGANLLITNCIAANSGAYKHPLGDSRSAAAIWLGDDISLSSLVGNIVYSGGQYCVGYQPTSGGAGVAETGITASGNTFYSGTSGYFYPGTKDFSSGNATISAGGSFVPPPLIPTSPYLTASRPVTYQGTMRASFR